MANLREKSFRILFKSVKHFIIHEISVKDWIKFVKTKFDLTNKQITESQIKKICDITKGFPYYTQELFYIIWENSNDIVMDIIIEEAVSLIIERESDLYSYIWSDLTPNQKKVIKIIIEENGLNLYSNEILLDNKINANTLKSALESLLKKDIIDRKDCYYYLVDPLLKYWVEKL
ncbi:MAG: hypothetical protein ACQESP_11105 [Candidatus Muiribacteriota bacterium]